MFNLQVQLPTNLYRRSSTKKSPTRINFLTRHKKLTKATTAKTYFFHCWCVKKRCLKKAPGGKFLLQQIVFLKSRRHKTATRKIIIASRQIIANKHSFDKKCVYFTFFFFSSPRSRVALVWGPDWNAGAHSHTLFQWSTWWSLGFIFSAAHLKFEYAHFWLWICNVECAN